MLEDLATKLGVNAPLSSSLTESTSGSWEQQRFWLKIVARAHPARQLCVSFDFVLDVPEPSFEVVGVRLEGRSVKHGRKNVRKDNATHCPRDKLAHSLTLLLSGGADKYCSEVHND